MLGLRGGELILVWRINQMLRKMWDEIAYPFPTGATVEVWDWISYFITYVKMRIITYPC